MFRGSEVISCVSLGPLWSFSGSAWHVSLTEIIFAAVVIKNKLKAKKIFGFIAEEAVMQFLPSKKTLIEILISNAFAKIS